MLAPGVLAASFALAVAALGDRALFGLVNGFPVDSPAVWGGLWEAVSVLGLGLCALLLSLLFGAAQPRWLAAIAWCFATVGVSLHLVKLAFPVARPASVLPPELLRVFGVPLLGDNSMPSGHAATAFALLTVLLWTGPPACRRAAPALGLLAVAAAVSVSRMAVGAHWPSDVAAGALIGWVGALLGIALADRSGLASRLAHPRAAPWLAVALMACGVAVASTQASSPIASAWQYLLGAAAIAVGLARLLRHRLKSRPRGDDGAPARPWQRALTGTVLAVLVGAAAIGWLLRETPGLAPAQAGQWALLPAWLWFAVPVGLLLSYGCRAARLHAELGVLHGARYSTCLRLTLLHNAAINLLPMRTGELAYPMLVHRALAVPHTEAVGSLVWMRIQDLAVLALMALVMLPLPPAWRLAACIAAVAGVWALARLPRRRLRAAAEAPARRWAHRLLQLRDAMAAAPRHTATGWLCCAANWTLKLATIGLVIATVAGLPLPAALAGALGGEWAGVSPVQAPAGLGSYEAGVFVGAAVGAGDGGARLVLAALVAHAFVFGTAALAGLLVAVGPAVAARARWQGARP